jgi:FHS family Na+ dependent glucose MFS transporter 1
LFTEATLQAKQKRNLTISYFLSLISLGLTTAALGPSLPALAENTSALLSQISVLFTAKTGGYLLGSLVGGRLYDRLPGQKVGGTAIVVMIVTLALTPVIPLLWLLVLDSFLLGSVEGALDVGCNTMLVWVHGREVGPYMNALHFFFGLGTFVTPIIIAQSNQLTGEVAWGYWVIALALVPIAVWMLSQPSPSAPEPDEEKGGDGNLLYLILIAAFLFLYVGAEVGFSGWIYTYALEVDMADETTAAYLTSLFWGTFTLGRLLSVALAARLRSYWIVVADLIGCLLGLGVLLFFPASAAALWVGAAILGLSMASLFPSMISLAERRINLTGSRMSVFFVGGSSGAMLLPWIIGQLFVPVGPRVMIYAISASMLGAALVFAILVRSSRTKSAAI